MCGRGACGLDTNALKRICNATKFLNADKYFPSYNICPNNFIPVLLAQDAMLKYYKQSAQTKETEDTKTEQKTDDDDDTHQQQRILSTMRWGLVPSFSKDGKTTNAFRTINARQDTVKSKPMYRRLVNSKRCVVLFNGYYEWQTTKKNVKHKQPYFFTPQYTQNQDDTEEQPLMYMASLWDCWRDPNDPQNKLFTVTILTTDSNDDVSFCHHRMPLIMTKECVDKWLNTERYTIDECFKDIAESQKFIKIKNHAVPREIVGNTRTKGIECIQTLKEYEAKKRKTGLHKFFATAKPKKKEKKEEKVKVETVKNVKTDNKNISDDVMDDERDEELEQAIKASLEESEQDKKDEMKVDTDNEEAEEPMDVDLKKAIEASMESYTKEEHKRGKKRRLEEVEELEDLDELQITDKNPVKKRKLNSGSAKKQSTKRKVRKK